MSFVHLTRSACHPLTGRALGEVFTTIIAHHGAPHGGHHGAPHGGHHGAHHGCHHSDHNGDHHGGHHGAPHGCHHSDHPCGHHGVIFASCPVEESELKRSGPRLSILIDAPLLSSSLSLS